MELSTIIGLAVAFGALLGGVIMEGASIGGLVGISAAVIVVGGTIGATFISFPLKAVLSLPGLIMQSFFAYQADARAIIDQLVELADRARRDGLLALEETTAQIQDEFLRKGIMLVVDGVDSSTVQSIMHTDLELTIERHHSGIAVLEAMGGYAPTMGIIGTVMGLINVLSHLSDPGNLGGHIAVAFLATLYGIATANILYLPIAGKLRAKDEKEQLIKKLMIEGVLSVQSGQSPRIVRERLEAFLSPSQRGQEEK